MALAGLVCTIIPRTRGPPWTSSWPEAYLKVVEYSLAAAKTETYRLRRDDYLRVATRDAAEECSDVFRGIMDPST